MNSTILGRVLAGALAVAVSTAAGACGDAQQRGGDPAQEAELQPAPADTTSGASAENRSMTLVGCLQRGEGGDNFVLTQVNAPSDRPIATSGESPKADAVEREQFRAAQRTYALRGDDDGWEELVGRQVRVNGTLEEPSGLTRQTDQRESAPERADIDQSDLAAVEVQQVERIADACGSAAR
jgi:hypothetical protein